MHKFYLQQIFNQFVSDLKTRTKFNHRPGQRTHIIRSRRFSFLLYLEYNITYLSIYIPFYRFVQKHTTHVIWLLSKTDRQSDTVLIFVFIYHHSLIKYCRKCCLHSVYQLDNSFDFEDLLGANITLMILPLIMPHYTNMVKVVFFKQILATCRHKL